MDMTQLMYFTVIAKYNSLTKAAEELHISQPAMSSALKKLERELGVALFDRSANRIQLNDAGKAALTYAESMLRDMEQMKAGLQSFADARTITAAFCDPGVQWYCEPAFAAACPDVQMRSALYQEENEISLLTHLSYDIVVSPHNIIDPAVYSQPFLRDQVYLSVPKDSAYAAMQSASLRRLEEQPMLISTMGGYFLRNLEHIITAENPKVTLIKNDWIVTQQLIRKTNMLATSSTMALLMEVRNDGPHRTLIPVSDPEQQAFYHINCLRENRHKTKSFFEWAERCRKQVQEKAEAMALSGRME